MPIGIGPSPVLRVLLALLVGFVACRFSWIVLRQTLHASVFQRENYRRHQLPTAGGLVIVVSVLLIEAFRVIVGAYGIGRGEVITSDRALMLLVVFGFAFLGLVDDLGATGSVRGFRGHLFALGRADLTTGALKLFGGGALSVIAAALAGRFVSSPATSGLGFSRVVTLLSDAALIALAANLANLFDRGPGRTIKVSVLSYGLLVLGAFLSKDLATLVPTSIVIGAGLGLLLDDLHERVMLGDTGANLLGAMLGVGCVMSTSHATRIFVLLVLFVLNLLSEFVSFSAMFDRLLPLRVFDRAGTLAHRAAPNAGQVGARNDWDQNGSDDSSIPVASRGRRQTGRSSRE